MNILVIGNGFDIAHGLPTKYTHFLEFSKNIKLIYTYNGDVCLEKHIRTVLDNSEFNKVLCDFLIQASAKRKCIEVNVENNACGNNFTTESKELDELNNCVQKNLWIEYFEKCDMHGKENWIDFESEISAVIQDIHKTMRGKNIHLYGPLFKESDVVGTSYKCKEIRNIFLRQYKNDFGNGVTMKNLMDTLLEDLSRLTRAFEIYLYIVSNKIEIDVSLSDISELDIDHVVSFNYTHTYDKVYREHSVVDRVSSDRDAYIHGEVNIQNTIATNNMVLGIDEYLEGEEKDSDVTFIGFKKFYQRILKGCDTKVKDWIAEIKQEAEYSSYGRKFMMEAECEVKAIENNSSREYYESLLRTCDELYTKDHPRHNIYFFGHSMDVTDKDILKDLILNDNVNTTIYYYSKDGIDKSDKGQKIANLTKIIGQEELIKRTAGSAKTIKFVQQK